jgi:Flp pilus assembly protein TadG
MTIDFSQAITAEQKAAEAAQASATAIKAECRRAVQASDDPVWPDLPEGVADLAARF